MVVFGGRLEELDVQLVGQRFAPLVRYHALVFHVALVAHQNHLCVVPRIRLDLRHPATNKRVMVGCRRNNTTVVYETKTTLFDRNCEFYETKMFGPHHRTRVPQSSDDQTIVLEGTNRLQTLCSYTI